METKEIKNLDINQVIERYRNGSERLEKEIVQAIFKRNNAMLDCIENIGPECFTQTDYRNIYWAMEELYKNQADIDSDSVFNYIVESGKFIDQSLVEGLFNESYTSINIKNKSIQLRELFQRKQMLTSIRAVLDEQDQCPTSSLEILDRINDIAMRSNDIVSSDEKDKQCCSDPNKKIINLQELLSRKQDDMGLRTNFAPIDEDLRGLLGGKLWVVCADSQVGKSQFAVQLALGALVNNPDVRVEYYSLEMSKEEVEQRALALLADTEPKYITNPRSKFTQVNQSTGEITNLCDKNINAPEVQEFMNKLYKGIHTLHELDFQIDEAGDLDIHQICARIKKNFLQNKKTDGTYKKSVIVIDHMNICCGAPSISEEVSLLKDGYKTLKALAKKYDATIIALHQFTKGDLVKDDLHKPNIFALTGGSAPRHFADVIVSIWRPDVYSTVIEKNPTLKGVCEIDFAKVRYTRKPDVVQASYNGYEFKVKDSKIVKGDITTSITLDDSDFEDEDWE